MVKTDNPAFIFGMFETGLGVARSLGRNGIKVFGYDYKKDIGFYSRYVKAKISPNPKENENEFIEFISNEASHFSAKPVLYITSDEYIPAVINNFETLKDYFLINIPSNEIINSISNKFEQYLLAKKVDVPIPKTALLQTKEDIDNIIHELSFPVFIKGVNSNEWRKVFGGSKKGFVFKNKNEFILKIDSILNKGISLVAQELIEGPDTNHYKFCGYIDKTRKLKAGFCLKKIRQSPVHFGVGCVVESIKNDELMELGKKFFNAICYKGVGSAEFKFDEKDKKFKLIELNPRYWQQNILADICGINFPLIQYLDLTNQLSKDYFDYKTGIKWVNIYSDFDSFFSYRKENGLTFSQWIKSLSGKKVFSDYAKDDLLPAFYEIRFGRRLVKLPFYLIKRILSK